MIARWTFTREEIDLPDGRVLRMRRCRKHATNREGCSIGWQAEDELTLMVSTDVDPKNGLSVLHFSVSYAQKRAPSAADVRMVRKRLAELGAGQLASEPLAFSRRNVAQVYEISPSLAAFYKMDIPRGAWRFDLGLDAVPVSL